MGFPGTINASLADGKDVQRTVLSDHPRHDRRQHRASLGRGRLGRGGRGWGTGRRPVAGFITHYSGRVVANLRTERYAYAMPIQLVHPSDGMNGGPREVSMPDGTSI